VFLANKDLYVTHANKALQLSFGVIAEVQNGSIAVQRPEQSFIPI
jgi:hypothetical protein